MPLTQTRESLIHDPLAGYGPDGFLFAGPTGVLAADELGPPMTIGESPDTPGLLVGALPFDPTVPARLRIATGVRRGPAAHRLTLPTSTPPPVRWASHRTDAPAYHEGVRRALTLMDEGGLDKVVLARVLDLTADEPIDVPATLRALINRDPRGYTFATDTGSGTLIGTSPELLVRRTGTTVVSNPLAGSRPRDPDPEVDGRNATELLHSAKDRREHAMVVSAVAAGLAPLCRDLVVPGEPELLPTPAMWHLSTRVTGVLADPATTALDLAVALHPTPAVCGVPVDRARQVIAAAEPFDRGYYTGAVGWTDAAGDGEWVVAIRCGEVTDRRLRLYAGAGVVPGSTPESEYGETTAKFGAFLGALGLTERP